MNHVVFTCCYGEAFRRMLPYWYASLRGPGGYSGPVVVFTDRVDAIAGLSGNVTARPRPPIAGRDDGMYRKMTDAKSLDDLGGFDVALYADVDILFHRPVSPLFSLDGYELRVTAASIPIGHPTHAAFFDPAAARNTTLGVNAGLYCFPRRSQSLHRWVAACDLLACRRPPYCDQTVLNYLLWQEPGLVLPYPREWVVYPRLHEAVTALTVLTHYAGVSNAKRIAAMAAAGTGSPAEVD